MLRSLTATRLRCAAALAVALASACGGSGAQTPPPCTDARDDAALCAAAAIACGPATITDDCGAAHLMVCGDCGPAERCDDNGRCVACSPEDDAVLCARYGRGCGPLAATDSCGHTRSVDCGGCTAPWECSEVVHACVCVPESDRDFCAAHECGGAHGLDRCGSRRDVAECGPCTEGDTCVAGTCVLCTPESDAELCHAQSRSCGPALAVDACGVPRAVANCGACPGAKLCDPTGTCRVPGDACDFAAPLTVDASGHASVSGDLLAPTGHSTGSCRNTQGPDLVYTFTLGSESLVQAVLAPKAASAALRPALYLRASCDQPQSELGCSTSDSAGWVKLIETVPAGTWFLWADSNATGIAGFELTLTVSPPPASPANERCASATAIALPSPSGAVVVRGTTLFATDDSADTCGGGSGGDVVYTFFLAQTADVVATLRPTDWNAVLYARSGCADSAGLDTIACFDRYVPGDALNEAVTLRSAAPGLYSLWIDSTGPFEAGDFVLDVTVQPPQPAGNDLCSHPEPLDFAGETHVAVSGDTRGAHDDSNSTCGATDGPDLVYGLHLDHDQSVDVVVTADASATFQPAVYVRAVCDRPATEKACALFKFGPVRLSIAHLPPGDYQIIVDGKNDTAGAFTLDVTLGAPTLNDFCTNPELVLFDANGDATVRGDTRSAQNNLSGRCAPRSGRDVVYTFTTFAPQTLEVTATPLGASGLAPQLYIRSECIAPPSENGCAFSTGVGPVRLAISRMRADTWYLVVDSADPASAGPFELALSLRPVGGAPANDLCSAPELLTFDPTTKAVQVFRTTTGASRDYDSSCGGSDGPDVVFEFELTAPSAVRAEVFSARTGFEPIVYVRSNCTDGSLASEIGCTRGYDSHAALVTPTLAPGRYFVIVDSTYPADGPFELDLSRVDPLPENCSSARAVAIGAGRTVVQDDTFPARNDDASSGCGAGPGRDLVYALTTSSTYNLRVGMTWDNPFRTGQLYLRPACAGTAEVGCAAAAGNATETNLYVRALPAGTWWLWVDAAQASSAEQGPFTLEITAAAPPPAPANDACVDAAPLAFNAGVAHASADLGGASDDLSGSCGGAGGPDAVYTLVVPAGLNRLRAQVTTTGATPGFEPVLYLRSSCAGGEQACGSGKSAAAVAVDSLATGTHYLVVDSRTPAAGTFDLDVTLTAPATLPDACATAERLTFTSSNHLVLRGDSSAATDNTRSLGCLDGRGSDLVYVLDTTGLGARDLTASMLLDDATDSPVIYLRTVCAAQSASDELACNVGGWGTPATLVRRALPPGVYYLWADCLWSGSPFTLDLQLPPTLPAPANDSCAGATPLAFSTGVASASGTLTWAHDDASASCGGSGGRDVVYTFTTVQPQRLTARVLADTGLSPRVYLTRGCSAGPVADEITCAAPLADPRRATAIVNALPAGTYALWIDAGDAAGEGSFMLDATLDAAVAGPANESCGTAAALGTLAAGSRTTIPGTTAGAQSESEGACTALGAADVAYRFELGQAQRIVAAVVPSVSGFMPAVRLRAGACQATTDACGAAANAGAPALASVDNAAPGTWTVWVDGGGAQSIATSGAFTLTLALATPNTAPANDDCAGAQALARGVPVLGDTAAAANNFPGPLPGTCRGVAIPGRDVVYSFTPAASGSVEVVVTPAAAFAPVVWVADSCSAATCVGVEDYPDWDLTRRVTVNATAGRTLTVVVDSGDWGAFGPFFVEVR